MQLVLTDAVLTKIASARIGGPKVSITQFSIGFTLGTVNSALTSVPSQQYGPVDINSAFLADTHSAQYECVVPETVGTFDFNVIGLFDSTGTLAAIAKFDSTITKIASNLPTVIGNRLVLRAQLAITNADAVLNFTLNVLSNANLNFVATPNSLSGLASVGLYKTYRVLTMPDGYSDIASSNGTNWSYGRYNPVFVGTSASTAADLTHIVGDSYKPFKSHHVGSVLEFVTGPNAGTIRAITAVNEATNIATIIAVSTIPASGNSFLLSNKNKVMTPKSLVFADDSGYQVDDSNLVFDSTNKRLGLRKDIPTVGFHQLGGGIKLEALQTPSGPSISPQGSLGTTTYTYYIVAEDYEGNTTLPGNAGITSAGNATLNGSNFNRITWSAIPGAKRYAVLKANTTTFLGYSTSTTLDDTGQSTSAWSPGTRNKTADVDVGGLVSVNQTPENSNHLVTKAWVEALIADQIPPGSIVIWPSNINRTGWLPCNGVAVSRTTYANLFANIGTFFGVGDGSTTFNLPNFTGRSPIGVGISDAPNATTTFGLGQKVGEERHVQTISEMAGHAHNVDNILLQGGGLGDPGGTTHSYGTRVSGITGSSVPANIVHPSTVVNFIIKF